MNLTQSEVPLAVYTFGWGRLFRLYRDYLDIHGTHYALTDLTSVRSIFHHILGISSARLELHFGKKKLVLPGIADIEDVQQTVTYLSMRLHERRNAYATNLAEAAMAQTEVPGWYQAQPEGERTRALPYVAVPMLMLPGERGLYMTDAALCAEGGSTHRNYPLVDQGTLILTSRRVIYVGRKSQITLDYARLSHVSRLRNALALQARQRRVIVAMRRPLECATYLEYILRRFQADTVPQKLGERIGCGDDRYIDGTMEPR